MSAKPQEFPTLQVKVTWVLGFMQTGMAQMFQDHFLMYMTTPDYQAQYVQSAELDQIELLYRDIYKAFGDPNKQATTIQEITTIKQGSKTSEEHMQLFKQCYMRSGYATLDKWYNLVIRLDWQWRQAVAERKMFAMRGGSSTSGQTSTMQRAGQQGQMQANNQRQGFNQQAQRNWQALVNQQQQQWRPPAQTAPRDPNAMQVDRNHSSFRCYNCGQAGHMARTCPNPQVQQTRLISAWNSGTDANQDELWRMTGGGAQAGGSVAHIEEVPVPAPTTIVTVTQPPSVQFHPSGFQFGQ
ncbi:hypothetical protein AMATHDRAFT_5881 [Amanita thiersii Skay4041]|uniref:CCHC-type domain-containing protein n=1 Tax=Amanita thiersii Skay4041 TaxID=703135 RepID=A0A2A9NCJ9_9AGAR|nr:hypothetical protein AMATHDRAFT_5881 [Amanita thiersii Skay4041]